MTPFADPLATLDALFLAAEHPDVPMHIGATLVFEGGPFATRSGVVDRQAFTDHVASRLDRIPRYRQRLVESPLEGRMLWIDDDRFDVRAHIHRRPVGGRRSERDLKRAVGEILSRPLDRNRPLWELWILDRLESGRFAIVTKVHHCMADGLGGVDQLCALLDATPEVFPPSVAEWTPRPAPNALALAKDDVATSVRGAVTALAMAVEAVRDPLRSWRDASDGARSLTETATALLRPARFTPFNHPLGGERRFEWLGMSVADLRRVKRHFGVTLNDVVLATVAGALHRYLAWDGVSAPSGEVRAAVPVSMRDPDSSTGNQVSLWLLPLPADERDPVKRLDQVRVATAERKETGTARALYSLLRLTEGIAPAVLRASVRMFENLLPFNLIVTNVPGPQFPLYMNGARLVAAYPSVPLFENQGLGIALFSYDGMMYWGFLADPSVVPDLDEFVYSIAVSFCQLLDRAETGVVRSTVAA